MGIIVSHISELRGFLPEDQSHRIVKRAGHDGGALVAHIGRSKALVQARIFQADAISACRLASSTAVSMISTIRFLMIILPYRHPHQN
jgi:hypothetical protein